MSSTKPSKPNDHNSQQSNGWVTIKPTSNPSPNKRKRRRQRNKNKTTKSTHKPISTKPKHAAPANATTIYCKWFQEGVCNRGSKCFFIHELDPLSEKNPIEHKKMIKQLISPKKSPSNTIKIPLQKPIATAPTQIILNNNDNNSDGFILPSQNTKFQQTINNHKYNRYNDFIPMQPQPPNPYAPTMAMQSNPAINVNDNQLNANATEFIPTMPTQPPPHYNPYLTAENAHTANPYTMSADFVSNPVTQPPPNINESILNDPTFNEENYEIWEDENGEIIVVEKDQLYGDDPYYHDQKILKEFNNLRINNSTNNTQKGIRNGGNTYNYGANIEEKKQQIPYTWPSKNNKPKSNGYANMASKFNAIYPSNGRVESFANDGISNPDYNPNVKICHFWLNGTCLYNANCKMAHRFENNICIHCDQNVGKSPLIQQQHLLQCEYKLILDSEIKQSENIECGICKENIISKGSKFGLLTGCVHTFCLQCIREWRGVLHQSKDVVRSCPICRQLTYFIVPCDRFVMDKKRKDEIIGKYKGRLSEIRCKHFDEDEECPFGTSCFYKHVRKDGTVDEKKVVLRHMMNADGGTEIMKQMRLSEFLFGNDD